VKLATPLIHLSARLSDVADGLDLVDGRLRGLELLALGDDGARLREPLAQLAGARIRGFGTPAPEETRGDGADGGGGST
jgi:hypothetical protein